MEKDKYIGIINDNKKIIYKICNSYCKNAEDRKDLEQEIMIQLWKSMGAFNGASKVSTWIYRVALNVAISFYRKDSKRTHSSVSIDETILRLEYSEFEDEHMEQNLILLNHYINQLKELDKALMILYLDDHSYEEISGVLGISTTNVATKISRIKQSLKKQFSNN
ncbi:MAG: sigma-70 family RNA polymerase sigma factor [Bacteroidales bacterium]|nr:sigma-70 family RNA polymerase sigma factor [Bacteroidales bacterium]